MMPRRTALASVLAAPFILRHARAAAPAPAVLIENAHILSMDPKIGDISGGALLVRDGAIVDIGRKIDAQGAQRRDAGGQFLLPGFVDTHWHMWNAAARSYAPTAEGKGFFPTMKAISARYSPEDSYTGVRLSLAEARASGITTVHNWAHNIRTPAHAEAELRAMRDGHLRGRFGYGYPQDATPDERMDFADILRMRRDSFLRPGLIDLGVVVRGPERTPEAIWREEWAFARKNHLPLSVHIAVTPEAEQKHAIQALARAGLLGPDIQLVHCTHASAEDFRAIVKAGSPVSISPWTELRVGYGVPPIMPLQGTGPRFGLSVDNTVLAGNADFFSIMRLAISLAAGETQNQLALTARDVLGWATIGGARSLGLGAITGSLTPGKRADMILVDPKAVNMAPAPDPVAALVQSAEPADIRMVMVDGHVLGADAFTRGAGAAAAKSWQHLVAPAPAD